MIQHTVTFNLKHHKDSEEERNFLSAARKLAKIDGVKKFEVFSQISKKNNFTFALSMYFDGQSNYDYYNDHPDHVAFVKNIWLKEVNEFLELDYVIKG